MTIRTTWLLLAIGALCAAGETRALAERPASKPGRSRVALSHALPALDGDHLQATIVEVAYEPGGSSPAHVHPCPVMVYVVEGAIRTKVEGEPETIYRAGETFREPPGAVHQVSANASDRAPAKFVAIFVCDRKGPLTAPAAQPGGQKP